MREGLALLDQARRERGVKIAQRLEKPGFPGALAGARAEAGTVSWGARILPPGWSSRDM